MRMLLLRHCRCHPEHVVILAGVSAALHVGKMSPALPTLRDTLGVTLVQAGFLLSAVQLAGMLLGAIVGLAGDGIGPRRSFLTGLLLLTLCSALGAAAHDATTLLALRGLEGLGFLLASMPAPGLIRRLVAPARLNSTLGLWGTYMPFATALALMLGPWVIDSAGGWRVWWCLAAALSAAMAALLAWCVPADPSPPPSGDGPQGSASGARARSLPLRNGFARLRRTLSLPGPWLVAACFGVYSGPWLAVIGLLPSMVAQEAAPGRSVALWLALAALVNMAGNVAAGRLLQRGVPAAALLRTGFLAMALGALVAFAAWPDGSSLPLAARYAGVLLFSMVGGMVPGTLFSLAVHVAPDEGSISTTVGWMQQLSALGQFGVPPLVAWLAARMGNWHWTWAVTGLCSISGLLLARLLAQQHRGRQA